MNHPYRMSAPPPSRPVRRRYDIWLIVVVSIGTIAAAIDLAATPPEPCVETVTRLNGHGTTQCPPGTHAYFAEDDGDGVVICTCTCATQRGGDAQ